jgi:hypothetical protein
MSEMPFTLFERDFLEKGVGRFLDLSIKLLGLASDGASSEDTGELGGGVVGGEGPRDGAGVLRFEKKPPVRDLAEGDLGGFDFSSEASDPRRKKLEIFSEACLLSFLRPIDPSGVGVGLGETAVGRLVDGVAGVETIAGAFWCASSPSELPFMKNPECESLLGVTGSCNSLAVSSSSSSSGTVGHSWPLCRSSTISGGPMVNLGLGCSSTLFTSRYEEAPKDGCRSGTTLVLGSGRDSGVIGIESDAIELEHVDGQESY